MPPARPRFPVLFSLRGFLGQVFSGHPGTLTYSFSLITFAVAMFLFSLPLKWVMTLLPGHIQYSPVFVGYCHFLFFY